MKEELQNILSDYLLKGVDPYFSIGYRASLRYATKEYLYAVLMETNPKGIDILDYLYFAKADLQSNDLRGAINAIGNANRAIHLLIDAFLEIAGLKKAFGKDNFPNKLEIIRKLEAFPTRLLKNLNKKRNIVEHEYDQIDFSEAEEFVEIAEIFIKLCYPYFRRIAIGARIGEKASDKDIEWLLDPSSSIITVSECQGSTKLETELYGPVYHELKTKPDKAVFKSIDIKKTNVDQWLPILNTLIYITQRWLSHKEPPIYNKEEYSRIMKFSVERLV